MTRSISWKKEWRMIGSFAQWGRRELITLSHEHIKYLRPRKTDVLLDIGCNDGMFDIMLAPLVKRIDAIDIAPIPLQGYPTIHMRKGDILKLSEKRYDIVLCGSVLHYLKNLGEVERALAEISRVTKRRAFCTFIPDKKYKQQYLDGIWQLERTEQEKQRMHDRNDAALWIAPDELRVIARKAGFKTRIVKIPSDIWQSWYMFNILLQKI